ncbi:hypothetical protein LTR37_002195 [Vermiconidia calcicola]|uniref:Uncharacterized protein n=1 Tax=Vermiconidia calcicola TaxID=1690605 RepID=A0ACC3NTV3_9PEZI|nr:hypothetical protein LTR37_002195 [Vermiconidia calcicola]
MAPRWCIYVAHQWRLPKIMLGLFVLELPLTVAALALFGIADPNTYRTRLWQNGADKGFNSNPNEILYAYANYRPISVPLIWSQFITTFNVIISVLSLFVLLVKSTMYVLHTFVPLLSVFIHALLIALYAVSIRNQATPDVSNTKVPNLSRSMPWYLSKGCSHATAGNEGYCMQARASFGVTITMFVLFILYFALSVWSSIITPAEKSERKETYDTDIELKNARYTYDDPNAGLSQEEKWERNRQIFLNLPKTPNTPRFGGPAMTPRTTAFTQLSGEGAPATGSSTRPLAFRQQFEREVRVPDPI